MHVEVTAGDPHAIGADLVAAAAGARAAELGAPERAVAAADPVAMVYAAGAPLAVVALEPHADGLRTGAARAVRACRGAQLGRPSGGGCDQIGPDRGWVACGYLDVHRAMGAVRQLEPFGKIRPLHSNRRHYDLGQAQV